MSYKNGIFESPSPGDISQVPDISLGDYMMNHLRTNLPTLQGRTWVHDILAGTSVKFEEIEDLSMRIGSALTRLGFKKGDELFSCTFESAQLYLINLTVWRLGGFTRASCQIDFKETYVSQIQEDHVKLVLVDEQTAPVILEAIGEIEWPVQLFCFGNVDGATSVTELMQDDGSAFPEHVNINPREDVVVKISTSGSTGKPKAVLHSHYNAVACIHSWSEFFKTAKSALSSAYNFMVGSFVMSIDSLVNGGTIYFNPKFEKDTYFDLLLKYKPERIMLYPYSTVWFARAPQLKANDLSFLKAIHITAAVADPGTLRLIRQALPDVSIEQAYGQTECMLISTTKLGNDPKNILISSYTQDDNNLIVSTGKLGPYVKAKVQDIEDGHLLGPRQQGEIWVKMPYSMLGYFRQGHKPNRDNIDSEGFLRTEDFGFIDADGNVYVVERISTIFKYKTFPVAPSEIETLLKEHEAVEAAGVVGVPNIATDHLARAFVVLRAGYHVTAEELQGLVAARLPEHKHLHGGVRFVDALPVNRSDKLDRIVLKKLAIRELDKNK